MIHCAAALAILASAATEHVEPVAPSVPSTPAVIEQTPTLVPAGTPVRLMVLREVNSRTARPGDKFKLASAVVV